MDEWLRDELRHEVVNALLSLKGIVVSSSRCTFGEGFGRFISDGAFDALCLETEGAISALHRCIRAHREGGRGW